MKKLLFAAVAVFAFGVSNAQEESTDGGFSQGDVFVSGSLTFGTEKTGDFKVNTFEVAPKVGYFLTDNIAAGLNLGYASDKVDTGSADATNSGFGVGAFGRYYFTPANKFSLFAELGANYMGYKYEFDPEDFTVVDADVKEFGVNLGAGLNYFVSSNFSIEAGVAVLGYTSNDNGGNGAEKTNSFEFGGDWTAVSFGVNYKF